MRKLLLLVVLAACGGVSGVGQVNEPIGSVGYPDGGGPTSITLVWYVSDGACTSSNHACKKTLSNQTQAYVSALAAELSAAGCWIGNAPGGSTAECDCLGSDTTACPSGKYTLSCQSSPHLAADCSFAP